MTNDSKYEHIIHPIKPFYTATSKILILGSFPSVKSRESGFFYGHPQNRFWKMMTKIFKEDNIPQTVYEKERFLERHDIACWDTIHSCDIIGSSDSSIKNVEVNDLNIIIKAADIKEIYANGRKSYDLYMKYCLENTKRHCKLMPSTSPANAACKMDKLIDSWSDILKYCR